LQIAERLGVELHEAVIFDRPTVASLAEYVQHELANAS
jgi:hypothetical protein